jgi:Na+/H+ antiporter NhaD/arsenite permease-like protein
LRRSLSRPLIPAVLIFAGTYLVMAIGRLPGYRLDRAGAALLGASLMVAFGVLELEEALAAVDLATITLLLGMMIVVANLRLSGFFRLATAWAIARANRPLVLLGAVIVVTGVLSAFLVNDAICIVMTPLVLDLVVRLKRNPVPYLLAVAMASNAGSVATITGNPQNMIIGSLSKIPYGTFTAALSPVAVFALAAAFVLIAVTHRSEFFRGERLAAVDDGSVHYHRPLVLKSLGVLAAMVVLFFTGLPVAEVAILGGAILLVTRRVNPKKVYLDIDWPLLVMFAGLFIVVDGLEKAVLDPQTMAAIGRIDLNSAPVLGGVTAVLANLVSNVPAILVLRPFVAPLADPEHAWMVVAMAATLAGNFTLVGSVANLIVVEKARGRGVTIGFWQHFRVGAPLTLITIAAGTAWLGL